jgi:hypothetical protein
MMVWEQKRERRHYTLFSAKILATNVVKGDVMAGSTSVRINQELYEQAKQDAAIEHRSIAGQIEFWARVGRAALDNPDLPVSFIAESLASLAEPREYAQPFLPRSGRDK